MNADITAARRARDNGIATAEAGQSADQDRAVIDQAIEHFAASGEPFSSADVRRVLPVVSGALVGARFLSAARRGVIERCGTTQAEHEESHAHSIAIWRRATGAPAHSARKPAAAPARPGLTPDKERVIRDAHWALEARKRGKSGIHDTTSACKVIRDLLDILGDLTGVGSSSDSLF